MKVDDADAERAKSDLIKRTAVLFINFFLIILAYYQVKSASRSLLIEYWGSGNFPYVWIFSALVLGSFIGFYNRMVERHSRTKVVLASLLVFIALLIGFRLLLQSQTAAAAVTFYIFVDIFSVILVEQFWSLTNTITEKEAGKKSYWLVGTGGLVGGALGGGLSSLLLTVTSMGTADLLLVSAAILCLTFVLNLAMSRMGLFEMGKKKTTQLSTEGGWRLVLNSRYLLLIAVMLFCAQMAQPIVEFQFLRAIEAAYHNLDARTTFISSFFGVLGIVSIAVNLVLTPFIHRYLGIFAGMLIQPVAMVVCSAGFMMHPVLTVASIMKIADRGLSYSINRASKEQLYIPVDPVETYQAKAWIDMLGYRVFKIAGAGLILLLTQWLPFTLNAAEMSWPTMVICVTWIGIIAMLYREYRGFSAHPALA